MERVSKTTIYVGLFMTILSFLNAYRYWGGERALFYFFLTGGIVLGGLNVVVVVKRKMVSDRKNT